MFKILALLFDPTVRTLGHRPSSGRKEEEEKKIRITSLFHIQPKKKLQAR